MFIIKYGSTYNSRDLSRRRWSPATTGPPGPFVAIFVAMDGPPGPSMATIDGPPCCKWSPQVFTVLHGVSGIATKL